MNIIELSRRNQKLTQITAAEKLGWSVRKYNTWESHPERLNSINFKDILKLSTVLGIETSELFKMFNELIHQG